MKYLGLCLLFATSAPAMYLEIECSIKDNCAPQESKPQAAQQILL